MWLKGERRENKGRGRTGGDGYVREGTGQRREEGSL